MNKPVDISLYPGLEKLPSRLVSLRVAKGLSQTEAARQMGISKSVLNRAEKEGPELPAITTIYTICRHYNVSSDSLIFGTARYPDGTRETNGEYTYENKLDRLVVTVPHEMIESLNILRKVWDKGSPPLHGWILVEMDDLAEQALQKLKNNRS